MIAHTNNHHYDSGIQVGERVSQKLAGPITSTITITVTMCVYIYIYIYIYICDTI